MDVPDLSKLGARTTLWELEQRSRPSTADSRKSSRSRDRGSGRDQQSSCIEADLLRESLKEVEESVAHAEEENQRDIPSRRILSDLLYDLKDILSKSFRE